MTKNRDNPLAIQENDASAPTIAYATTAGSATTATTAGSITSQGALATLNSVSSGEIDADSVGASELKTAIGGAGSTTIASSSYTLPAGWTNVVKTAGTGNSYLELYVDGAWRTSTDEFAGGTIWSDGTNMRITETSSNTDTLYVQFLG